MIYTKSLDSNKVFPQRKKTNQSHPFALLSNKIHAADPITSTWIQQLRCAHSCRIDFEQMIGISKLIFSLDSPVQLSSGDCVMQQNEEQFIS